MLYGRIMADWKNTKCIKAKHYLIYTRLKTLYIYFLTKKLFFHVQNIVFPKNYTALLQKFENQKFKNLTAFAARFLKCVWPFYDIAK